MPDDNPHSTYCEIKPAWRNITQLVCGLGLTAYLNHLTFPHFTHFTKLTLMLSDSTSASGGRVNLGLFGYYLLRLKRRTPPTCLWRVDVTNPLDTTVISVAARVLFKHYVGFTSHSIILDHQLFYMHKNHMQGYICRSPQQMPSFPAS